MITKIPVEIISIEKEGFHLIIQGKINKKKSNLIVDTGASKSVFNKKLSGKIKEDNINQNIHNLHTTISFSDEIPSMNGIIKEFQIGTLHKYNLEVTFIDIDYINRFYKITVGKKIDGLIGNDLLVTYQAKINYADKSLTLTY